MEIGYVSIKQDRNVVHYDSDSIKYQITTTLSNPTNFPEFLSALAPHKLFVYEEETFMRVCGLDELRSIPTDEPTEFGGEYRRASVIQETASEKMAASYARGIYRSVEQVLLATYDFLDSLINVTETGTVPDLAKNELRTKIDDYVALKSKLQETQKELYAAKSVEQALKEVTDLTYTEDKAKLEEGRALLTSLNKYFSNLWGIVSSINLEQAAKSLNTITNLYDSGSMATLKSLLNSLSDVLNNSACQSNSNCEDSSGNPCTYHLNPNVSSRMQELTSNLTVLKSSLTTVLSMLSTGNSSLIQAQASFEQILGMLSAPLQNINAYVKNSNAKGVVLQDKYFSVCKKRELLEKQYNTLMSQLQNLGAELLNLEPNIDLEDPLAIYNHRFFKLITE